MYKVTGIDISKQTFDVSYLNEKGKWEHDVYHNNKTGFKKLLKKLGKERVYVMEASGSYYLKLAQFLYANSAKVSVVNPLVIRRYAQMKLLRAKTDKKDAQVIANYAMEQTIKFWKPVEDVFYKMKQLNTLIDNYKKQLTMLRNQQEAFNSSGTVDKNVKRSINKNIKKLKEEIKQLSAKLEEMAKTDYEETMKLLESIPGIGPKTAIMLIIITNNFTKFENYKLLISYIGLSPRIIQSGTSVNGKGHIAKIGNKNIRKLLYMCTWTAKIYNKQAVEMYNRLKSKGKPERVIKIAIANKLLKQAFAIVKSKKMYDADYKSGLN